MADEKDWSDVFDSFGQHFSVDKFKSQQYKRTDGSVRGYYYTEASDAYANLNQMFVSFQHVPSGQSIFLKAFITAFNESYSSDWAEEQVYGRADPIYLFKNTKRSITMAIKLPAASEGEAYENLTKISALTQFLYPTYETVQNANTISQSPMIRIKLMNILSKDSGKRGEYHTTNGMQQFDAYRSDPNSDGGVLGVISSFVVNHNLEGTDGVFHKLRTTDEGIDTNVILPKLIDINLTFNPIHETPLGWEVGDKFTKFKSPGFPYGTPPDMGDIFKIKDDSPQAYWDRLKREAKNQAIKDQHKARYGNWLTRGARKNADQKLYNQIQQPGKDGYHRTPGGEWHDKDHKKVDADLAERLDHVQTMADAFGEEAAFANDMWGYDGPPPFGGKD